MKTKFFSAILILISVAGTISAKDITTRKKLRVDRNKIGKETVSEMDTLRNGLISSIEFAGFDKPLRSGYETVFVTNRSPIDVKGLVIECDYTDLSGRQLHNGTHTVACDIPAGQTRQIKFRTWDSQQAFYYRRSSKPRRADGTPFDVRCTCRAIITTKNNI